MKKGPGLVVAVAFACPTGCGKSDSEKFADSYCAEVAKCCGQASLPADGQTCHQLMTFTEVGGSYNSSAGDACLAEMKSEVSAGTFCTGLNASSASACDSVYGSSSGNKKPGETCIFDSDCAPSSKGKVVCASIYVNSTFVDKCQVQIAGKAGDTPCVGTQEGNDFSSYQASDAADVVPQGYVCDVASAVACDDGTCVALTPLGASCLISTDCVRTAYCSYPQDVCTTKISAGGACTGIAGSECVDSAYCDTSALQCKPKVADGGACTSLITCQSGYCSNGTCQGSSNLGLSMLCGS
jgi:hypothetical protein